jgi:5-methylcytosine-specific restriction protein A
VFTEGQTLRRGDIHDMYGGSRQSGICPSAKMPYIFIFTGSSGHQHGYKDEWLNEDVFSYTGEGQSGDMQFKRGNLALKDHLLQVRRLFLFQYMAKGIVKFVSELRFLDYGYFETHDTNANTRIGIKFFFHRVGESKYSIPDELSSKLSVFETEGMYGAMPPNETERKGLVTSRVGQGAYRKSILHRWKYKCAVTDFNDTRILIASHILPWKDGNDKERLDVDNGILLSPDFDALFDKHLISFDHSSGELLVSNQLIIEHLIPLGLTGKERIKNLTEGNKSYLHIHNQLLV